MFVLALMEMKKGVHGSAGGVSLPPCSSLLQCTRFNVVFQDGLALLLAAHGPQRQGRPRHLLDPSWVGGRFGEGRAETVTACIWKSGGADGLDGALRPNGLGHGSDCKRASQGGHDVPAPRAHTVFLLDDSVSPGLRRMVIRLI
jgi:hypothetical protein